MQQIFAAEEVQQNFIDASSDKEDKIRSYFQDNYFVPFHNEMIQILKAKLHLVEGAAVPPSFQKYLKHACDDRARRALNLWPKTLFPWPPELENHLTLGLMLVMEKYDDLIYRLETIKDPRRKRIRTQADFTYKITHTVISIVDTGLGQRSVIEDIKVVLRKIEYWHQGSVAKFKIMSQDGKGFWHQVQWDGKTASLFALGETDERKARKKLLE
jgi:hypothetical protein